MNGKKHNYNWIWILFVAFFFIGDTDNAAVMMLGILAVILIIALSAVHSSRQLEGNAQPRRRSHEYHSRRPADFSSADMARITVYLKHLFNRTGSLDVNGLQLRLRDSSFSSLSSLDVYQGNSYISSLNDFGRNYPDAYEDILKELRRRAEQPQQKDVFDAQVQEHQEKPDEKKESAEETKNAQAFIDEINELNQDIPDKEISDGLYETAALLKQIQSLEKKLPASKDKLTKLYSYYLPILIRILHQYVNLQSATTDENYERTRKKLTDTIHLINEAMKNIISSMTDADFINLSADISTLETLLRKDGLTDEGNMQMKDGGQDE